jgi:hypothetical protein
VTPEAPSPCQGAPERRSEFVVSLSRREVLATIAALATTDQASAPDATPLRVIVVFGDSQAEGLAAALRRAARQIPGIRVQNHTKAGTAISQPENYDWPAAIRAYAPDPQVDTAVLMFGGNDRLPMRPSPGTVIPFRSETWNETYRGRTSDMLHTLAEKHLRIFWVSNPICRDEKYSKDMEYLNAIYRAELVGTDAKYVDVWTAVADTDGRYAPYGRTLEGATARLRLDDGIHFTSSGYDILATRVMQAVMASEAGPK